MGRKAGIAAVMMLRFITTLVRSSAIIRSEFRGLIPLLARYLLVP